jgi:hypothetical protein
VEQLKEMGDATIKHLELIQGVINRMGSNSFAVKAWAVGLMAAIFALAAEKGRGPWFLLVAILPVLIFWFLDAFYLRQERLFRRLYDAVRNVEESAKKAGPFGMNTKPYEDEPKNRFWAVFWSHTIMGLYVPLAALVLIVFVFVCIRRG